MSRRSVRRLVACCGSTCLCAEMFCLPALRRMLLDRRSHVDDRRRHRNSSRDGREKGGGGRCPGPFAPITIKLAAPIGQRKIAFTGSFCPRGPYGPRALESPDPIGENPWRPPWRSRWQLARAAIGAAMATFLRTVRQWRRAIHLRRSRRVKH